MYLRNEWVFSPQGIKSHISHFSFPFSLPQVAFSISTPQHFICWKMNLEGQARSFIWLGQKNVKWENFLMSWNKGQNKKWIVIPNKDIVWKKTYQYHSIFSDPTSRRPFTWTAPPVLLCWCQASPVKQIILLASIIHGVCSLYDGRGVLGRSVLAKWGLTNF